MLTNFHSIQPTIRIGAAANNRSIQLIVGRLPQHNARVSVIQGLPIFRIVPIIMVEITSRTIACVGHSKPPMIFVRRPTSTHKNRWASRPVPSPSASSLHLSANDSVSRMAGLRLAWLATLREQVLGRLIEHAPHIRRISIFAHRLVLLGHKVEDHSHR